MFYIQRSYFSVLQCSFQFFDGNAKLQYKRGTDRGTVLWFELGSEDFFLGGPDLFSVQCSVLGSLQGSFQCSDGDTKLQSHCGTDRGTVLWPELGSKGLFLGGPDLFSVQRFYFSALKCSFQCSDGDTKLQSQCGIDRGAVLWPELSSQ